jgi:hypothetical protein
MPNNTLSDLNNHLFAQLERLGDEDMNMNELSQEIERARAISYIAKNVIENAKVALDGAQFRVDHLDQNKELPEQFKDNRNGDV